MFLEISAVFKIVDDGGETVLAVKSSVTHKVDDNTKKATKKELYESLRQRVVPLMDNCIAVDMSEEEYHEYQKEDKEEHY